MTNNKELLWNDLLEGIFEDMVRFIYPPIDKELDLKRGFTLMDQELGKLGLERRKGDATQVDKLIKVFRKDGTEDWVLLHVEEMADTHLPERVFKHYIRIWARRERSVVPLVVVVGTEGVSERLDCYTHEDLFSKEENVRLEYQVCNVASYEDEELAAGDNPFSLAMLAAKKGLLRGRVTDDELLEQKIGVAKVLLDKKEWAPAKVEKLLAFLKGSVVLGERMEKVFEKRVGELREN